MLWVLGLWAGCLVVVSALWLLVVETSSLWLLVVVATVLWLLVAVGGVVCLWVFFSRLCVVAIVLDAWGRTFFVRMNATVCAMLLCGVRTVVRGFITSWVYAVVAVAAIMLFSVVIVA